MFEIFFDLVFVFAITRVVACMESSPGPRSLLQGLLLLVLLWWACTAFIWLGNQVRLDRGYARIGTLVALAGLFVAALVIPQAWTREVGSVRPALVLALAFTMVRVSYVAMFIHASRDHPQLHTQVRLDVIPQSLSSALLIIGACLGGTLQTILWACAFGVDFGGGRIASRYRGWRLGSAGHFVERHGLIVIIAIGETLVAAGTGTGTAFREIGVLVAALLVLVIAISLWWLYFDDLAGRAERALSTASAERRPVLARDGYTLAQFPLIAGVVYVALGVKLLLDDLVQGSGAAGVETQFETSVFALCAGVALYLIGIELVRRILLDDWRPSRLLTAVLLGIIATANQGASPLVPLALVASILVCVCATSACGALLRLSRRLGRST